MSEYTPGPWEAIERDGRVFVMSRHVRHVNATGCLHDVAYLAVSNGCGIEDARLIAAAPDLLEAAKLLEKAEHDRQFCDNCKEAEEYAPETCPNCFPAFDDARIMRRNAIAKAEGSAP